MIVSGAVRPRHTESHVPQRPVATCAVCRGPASPPWSVCWSCSTVVSAARSSHGITATRVRFPLIVPVALYRPGDAWHRALRRYKDAPVAEARRYFAELLARRLEEFLHLHCRCLEDAAGGAPPAVAVVPSSSRRPVGYAMARGACQPVDGIVDRVPALDATARIRLRRGAAPVEHLAPHPDAYEVMVGPASTGGRVLLVDDTFTTGAHLLSAALALRGAGFDVPMAIVLGRCVDPDASPRVARWWGEAVAGPAASDAARPCRPDVCRRRDG